MGGCLAIESTFIATHHYFLPEREDCWQEITIKDKKGERIYMNRKIIPALKSQISFLYIDYGKIVQSDSGICLYQDNKRVDIPCGSILCIMIGPGTSITHRAVENIADSGSMIIWTGNQANHMYAYGIPDNQSTENLLRQIKYHENIEKHLLVARRMYAIRFSEKDKNNLTKMNLAQMRGAEGNRMKKIYQKFSEEYHVPWTGRNYKTEDWENQNEINKALSVSNRLLYNICHAAIMLLGYSPSIGFIHTGSMRSFVYDVADLYKEKITIPTAFEVISENDYNDLELKIQTTIRKYIKKEKLLSNIPKNISFLFDEKLHEEMNFMDLNELWDKDKNISSGKNYGD